MFATHLCRLADLATRVSTAAMVEHKALIGCLLVSVALGGLAHADPSGGALVGGLSDSPEDLSTRLHEDERRNSQRESLLPVSPLGWLHGLTNEGKQKLYDATNLKLGLAYTQVFQGITDAPPGGDDFGTVADLDFFGTWEVLNQGKPTQGKFYFQFEGRWNYGTTDPSVLGGSVGSIIGTANGFGEYVPTFLPLRNIYWEHGSKEAGWVYRVGKITPDAIFGTSKHISPNTAFLSNAATGPFSMGLPDSGLGIAGAYHFSDDVKILAAVSDANADRQNWGDLGEGDLFAAAEIGARLFPLTENAGFSKLAFWYSDGTSDGLPINASTGVSGWGFFAKHEQELTSDGKTIGILR